MVASQTGDLGRKRLEKCLKDGIDYKPTNNQTSVHFMKVHLKIDETVEINECGIDYLDAAFKPLLPIIFGALVQTTLIQFGENAMIQKRKPFACVCGNDMEFHWKTKNAKSTEVTTIISNLNLPQMQVQCNVCGKKMFITRQLLGIDKYHKMSEVTERKLALVGSLTTFRVSEKIISMFSVPISRMAVWRCVQKIGKSIKFEVDPNELGEVEADGTGIPIIGIKKRGNELKVLVQKMMNGIRIAGLTIGKYNSGWDKLFAPSIKAIKSFKRFLIITDGDTSILNGLDGVKVLLQRCLWHIPHQFKFTLWADNVKRKSTEWLDVMGKIYNICGIRSQLDDEEIGAVIELKKSQLEELISFCNKCGYKKSEVYLFNAKADMFTALENRMKGKASSHVERVMRTVNMRVNVGKWTPSGALNAMNLRLAYYYNGWTPEHPKLKKEEVEITCK